MTAPFSPILSYRLKSSTIDPSASTAAAVKSGAGFVTSIITFLFSGFDKLGARSVAKNKLLLKYYVTQVS
jgi:hypothetical protein